MPFFFFFHNFDINDAGERYICGVSGMGAGEAEASTGALVSLRLWKAALRFRRTLVTAQYLDSCGI